MTRTRVFEFHLDILEMFKYLEEKAGDMHETFSSYLFGNY